MTYEEVVMDLFENKSGYAFAQCISADFGMGKGIAVKFNEYFDTKNRLKKKYPEYLKEWIETKKHHGCILDGCVLNLVTKERYWGKPSYNSIRGALEDMKIECLLHNIQNVAMPKIGCGLDRLEWDKVSEIIFDVFSDTAITIRVCFL